MCDRQGQQRGFFRRLVDEGVAAAIAMHSVLVPRISGKLKGEMPATTPKGRRKAIETRSGSGGHDLARDAARA
jgi:hypothetical protein